MPKTTKKKAKPNFTGQPKTLSDKVYPAKVLRGISAVSDAIDSFYKKNLRAGNTEINNFLRRRSAESKKSSRGIAVTATLGDVAKVRKPKSSKRKKK